jgi:hypothetical protein
LDLISGPVSAYLAPMNDSLSIRPATDSDQPALTKLAALDSQKAPTGDALLAFEGDLLVAALPIDGGRPLADPFRRTVEIVELLQLHAGQSRQPRLTRRLRPTWRPRTA